MLNLFQHLCVQCFNHDSLFCFSICVYSALIIIRSFPQQIPKQVRDDGSGRRLTKHDLTPRHAELVSASACAVL